VTRPSTAGIVIFRRPAGPCSAAGARGCFGPPHVVWRCDRAARHGAGCVIGAHHGDFGAILGGRGTVYLSWSGHVVVTDGRGLGRDLTIPLGECRPVGDQLWCTIVAVRPPRGRFRAATAVSPAGLDAAGTLLAVDRDDATILAYGAGLALIVDEFALLLDLKDVYWAEEGRVSIDLGISTISAVGTGLAAGPVLRRLIRRVRR